MNSDRHDSTTRRIFRLLVLITALANIGGNVLILLFHRPILAWVNAPLPVDIANFVFVCGFSFTMGIFAWIIYCNHEDNLSLIVAVIIGKGIYAGFSFYFYYTGELHWFYRVFGVWDACYTAIFFLLFIHLVSPDLTTLNRGVILASGDSTPRTRKALIVYFSLTGNGARAIQRVKSGLAAEGYAVEERMVEVEPRDRELFQFPFRQRFAFLRIMIRAIFRIPTKIEPLGLSGDHDFDLIVVESQTWFIGISAPMEAVFQDPRNHAVFAGRDVAIVNVCRGLWRRPQAMLVRRVQACGGRVVGARAFTNPGREPIRTFSLFIFLATSGVDRPAFLKGVLTPQFLSDEALNELKSFGRALARRPAAPGPHQLAGGV